MAIAVSRNSTNVRNIPSRAPVPLLQEGAGDRRRWVSHVPRTLAVAALAVIALAAAAWDARLLERLDRVEILVLAGFGIAFAALTLACDGELRAALRRATAFRTAAAKSPGAKRAAT